MATMEEIAKKAGVSQATVSKVINGYPSVRPETRQKVMKWVRKLDYQPNLTAQSLVKKQSYLLGVIVPEISNPYFSEVLEVVEREARLDGYNIIFCDSGGNSRKEKESVSILRRRQIDGLLISPVDQDASHLTSLIHSRIPVVMIARDVAQFDSVCISLKHGGALAAEHLIKLGHTNIAAIDQKGSEKFQGFHETLKKYGILFHPENLIELESGWEQLSSHEIHEKFTRYIEKKERLDVTALFAHNDLAAFVVSRILQEHGYSIPHDIAVVGFDNTFLASEARPTLTSIAQPIAEIGRLAIETLLKRISKHTENEEMIKIILEPSLVVRDSTRKTQFNFLRKKA